MKIFSLILFGFLLSCGGSKKAAHVVVNPSGENPGPGTVIPGTGDVGGGGGSGGGSGTDPGTGESSDGISLELLTDKGSAMRFLDADGLQVIYARVFSKQALGYTHCSGGSLPRDPIACDGIFSESERPLLGNFDLYSPRMKRGVTNVNRTTNLTLNYMRSLRAALGRECTVLVSGELQQLKNDMAAQNKLVRSETVTAEAIENYFRILIGAKGYPIAVDIDAKGYTEDFKKYVLAEASTPDATKNAYINLCIAVSMDPQIFLY